MEENQKLLMIMNNFSDQLSTNYKTVLGLAEIVQQHISKTDQLIDRISKDNENTEIVGKSKLSETITKEFENLHTHLNRLAFPETMMQVLCDQLKTNSDLLLNPKPQRVIQVEMNFM